VTADIKPRAPRVVPPEAVPPPYKGNSVVRSVIAATGPIGRRLVIVAGVLVSVLIGIGAYRLEDRTQLIPAHPSGGATSTTWSTMGEPPAFASLTAR
jgi:hypothetical protein